MPRSRKSLQSIIERLKIFYGQPRPPEITDPFEMILRENVAYLVADEQRDRAFQALSDRVGLSAEAILSAGDEALLDIARLGGMHPDARVNKLRTIAQTALREFAGNLEAMVKRPLAQGKKALKRFPGIGDPGAEKILLFSRSQPILALESNGLRVLVRLGFAEERKSYAATYIAAQEAVREQVKEDFDWLIAAHQLLQRHGREVCKRSAPRCKSCPLTRSCSFYTTSAIKEGLGDV